MSPDTAALPALLSVAEAAELLGVGEQTLRDHLRSGEFPVKPRRLGRRSHLKFSRAELERWLAAPTNDLGEVDTRGP